MGSLAPARGPAKHCIGQSLQYLLCEFQCYLDFRIESTADNMTLKEWALRRLTSC